VSDLAQTNNPGAWRCLEFLQLPTSPYLWTDKSVAATGSRFYRTVAMEPPANMVFIPPGIFRMGSPTDDRVVIPQSVAARVIGFRVVLTIERS
jgi:hypothetical protein